MKCQPYIVTSNAFIETMHMVEHNEIQNQQNPWIINPNWKLTKISLTIVSYIKEFNIFSLTCEVEFQNVCIIGDAMSTLAPLLPTLNTNPHPIPCVWFQ
jgi:hypothetical protein